MLVNRKQIAEKQHKIIFSKQIVTRNPIFSKEHIQDFFKMFNLYCDVRRQCDINDILKTAKTLGFQKKYKFIYDALSSIAEQINGQWVNFETFLRLLTQKLGNPFTEEGRRSMFTLIDPENHEQLNKQDLQRISNLMHYNLTSQDIQEVINNVAGFGKQSITWENFNKYIAKKTTKKKTFL